MRAALAGACLGVLLGLGCGDDPPATARMVPTPLPPPAPIVAARPMDDVAAFDLVPAAEGALLFWAAPRREGGGLRVVSLDPEGGSREPERPIARSGAAAGGATEQHLAAIVEVVAASVGGSVAVAWVADHGRHLESQASLSTTGGRDFRPAVDLGRTVRLPRDQRGRLSVAGSTGGSFVVHHRVPERPCTLSAGPCSHIDRQTLGGGGGARDASLVEVEHPCEPLVSGAIAWGGSWYYALCHSRTTQVLVIDPDPSLATPVDVGVGCDYSGMAPVERGVAVLSRCGDHDAAVVLDEAGATLASLAPVERTVACEEARPVLTITGSGQRHRLRLGQAVGSIEALLPDELAPRGARAIWTGEAVLIAAPVGRELLVKRYQCVRGDGLVRTDVR